jgi:hypothetical protein
VASGQVQSDRSFLDHAVQSPGGLCWSQAACGRTRKSIGYGGRTSRASTQRRGGKFSLERSRSVHSAHGCTGYKT